MKLLEIPTVVTSFIGLCFLTGLEAPVARADFTFGEPVNIDWHTTEPFHSDPGAYLDGISGDGLEMFVSSNRTGGQGSYDLWVFKRAAPENDWGPMENLGPTVNTAHVEFAGSLTGDGLEWYFCSDRPGGYGRGDLYVTKRATRDSPWSPPTNLGPNVNSSDGEGTSSVSSDGLELYFISDRRGGYGLWDIYVSKRATRNDPWGPASNLGPGVSSPAEEGGWVHVSPDGLLLFVMSNRAGGYGGFDIWMARRTGRTAAWQPVSNLGPVFNGPTDDGWPYVTPDGSALYFFRDGGATYWKASITPTVDFNADGKVDLADLVMLIENWGSNKTLYDIGPMPWGDGKVDIEDLKVFMTYYEKENPPKP